MMPLTSGSGPATLVVFRSSIVHWMLEADMTEQHAYMPLMGLYYPYIHFRDDDWLKLAALYWPRMARVVPPGYPLDDSELVRRLNGELNFVVNVPPTSSIQAAEASFTQFINSLSTEQRHRWAVSMRGNRAISDDDSIPVRGIDPDVSFSYTPRRRGIPGGLGHLPLRYFSAVHLGEVTRSMQETLVNAELAFVSNNWLAMSPELVWLYKCQLTQEIAHRNRLAPTTDQLVAYTVLSPDNQALLGSQLESCAPNDIETLFGLLAIKAVVPNDLYDIPVDKIIDVRRRFGEQFDRWRADIDQYARDFADQLGHVESEEVLSAYMEDAVRAYSTATVKDLRRSLASVGVETVERTINSKFAVPATLTIGGMAAASLPAAAAAGMALGLFNIRRRARQEAHALQASPAAYLLSAYETLTPQSWISRVVRLMGRVVGWRG